MNLGSTILAFPHHKMNESIRHLKSVEWTAKMLDCKESQSKVVNAMLSIIDLSKDEFKNKQISLADASVQSEIAKNIELGLLKGVCKYVYGSPKTRENIKDMDEFINAFSSIANQLNQIQSNQHITIYIEPLPHEDQLLDTFDKVIDVCDTLNVVTNYDTILFKPLFDLGSFMRKPYLELNRDSAQHIADNTDRVHVSQPDVFNTINDLDIEYLNFLKLIALENEHITFVYEHINRYDNTSIDDFIRIMHEPLEPCEDVLYDVIIIGSGIYGLFSACKLRQKGLKVLIISKDNVRNDNLKSTQIASVVNQARVHNGYHYPRSITTAQNSVKHYERFKDEFDDCIIDDFNQIYAIPRYGTQTSASQFETFCQRLNVRCDNFTNFQLNSRNLQGSWLTDEVAVDTCKMMQKMLKRNQNTPIYFDEVKELEYYGRDNWLVTTQDNSQFEGRYVLNMSYAGINEIENKIKNRTFNETPIQFQVCEVALFRTENKMSNAYTFMDGPFISIMPHTQDGLISLTSVTHTPHIKSNKRPDLSELRSRKDFMIQEAKRFLSKEYLTQLHYVESRYVVKAIPKGSENNDNRLITINKQPQMRFASILSGKLNAVYELEDYLQEISDKCNYLLS